MAKVLRRNELENAIIKAQTEALKKGLAGELEVIEILESTMPESCIVIWNPEFLQYKPDILVIDLDLGFLFLEVKNWSLPYVKKFLSNGKSETVHGLKYPLGQTDNYINELQSFVNSMKEKKLDIYRMTFSLVIYTGFSKNDFLNRTEVRNWSAQNRQEYFKKYLFIEDLKPAPYPKLMSSKKFDANLRNQFTNEELNYLAKSLSHTDSDITENPNNTAGTSFPSDSTEVIEKEASKGKRDKSVRKLKISLYSLGILLTFFILFATADFFINPSAVDTEASNTDHSEEVYEQAVEDAKFALANEEYQKALGLYELALTEKPDDEETKASYSSLMLLYELTITAENGEWEEVITTIDELNNEGKVPSHLERKFQQLYKETVKKQAEQETAVNAIEDVKSLIAEEQFEKAQTLLYNLSTDQSMVDTLEKYKTNIDALSKEIEKGLKEVEQSEKVLVDEEKKETEKVWTVSNQTNYLNKLYEIENSMSELTYLYEDGITANILEAENESLKRWDDALNEIYSVLKITLSASEMESLRKEQREWIVYRDQEAEAAAKAFDGGSFEEVTLVSVKQQITRDRCYTLVEDYMK